MATEPPIPAPADEKLLTVVGPWGNREFHYADPNDYLLEAIKDILAGKAYPIPVRPAGHGFDTVVDIGANVGASALWFLARHPRRIVCFEPAADNLAYLRRNLSGLPTIEIHPFGLFNRDSEIPLYHGRHQAMQHSVVPSVETKADFETIALRRASVVFAEPGIDRISILKIDTEGCEVPILTDIAALLPRIELLYVEYHSERDRREIEALLASQFVLAAAEAKSPHRGVTLYMANRLVDGVPAYAARALARPR